MASTMAPIGENSRVFTMPEIRIHSGCRGMPVLGFGTSADPPVDSETTKQAVLRAIEIGYRHFDTAALYFSEQPLGEAVIEAIKMGLIKNREELFITSKLWCSDAHGEHVLPAIRNTLKNLKMDCIDLYLIHWPVISKPGNYEYPIKKEDFLPMDFKSVWAAMEECQRLGLTKSIGVSNFSCNKLEAVLTIAKIPPAINQVEVNPCWQQKKLRDFCKANGIIVTAYSPLGAVGTFYGTNRVMESEVLKEIAQAKGKTIAQVSLRWAYEQGIGIVVKSFNKDRMQQNLEIFNWELTENESKKISEILQIRACLVSASTRGMPVLGLGTVADPPVDSETTKQALLQAIKIGYQHFDTAALYGSEVAVGEAVIEAQKRGLIKGREELFITSKLWCSDAHGEYVLPALKKTLANLKMDYIDQYLIHWPVSAKPNPGVYEYPIKKEDFLPLDLKTVWPSMEECQKLGLTKSIGVSNFTIKKLEEVLSIAKIPPAANQVELHPCWQQKKLTEFCKAKGIAVVAFSPLGAAGTYYGTNRVMESEVLKEIARAREKSIAQIALRWEYEQGIVIVAKSFNPDRMKQNLEIFNWELSEDECKKISELPQARAHTGTDYTSEYGPYKTVEEIWDGDL